VPDGGSEWRVSLAQFNINRLVFDLEDQSVEPAADIGVQSLDLQIAGISNEPGAAFPSVLTIVTRTGGGISLDGSVTVLPAPIVDMELSIDSLALAAGHPYIKPLADVNLDSGALNMSGHLHSGPDDPLMLEGDLSVTDFLITETDHGTALGSWTRLDVERLALSVAANQLTISEVRFEQPYADVLIAEDGSINLGRVQKGQNGGAGDDQEEAEPDATENVEQTEVVSERGMAITIGRVTVNTASADFEDRSLPLPFAARIADLNGEMSTIATASVEPSEVAMEGKVDEYGQVRISGTVTPFEPAANTDLRVVFQNVEMPKFSAYTIPIAGREIASGKLDLDLGYKVNDNELVGENNVILRDFELGDKVEHPGALSLPLGLAVALLKDPDGTIDIDLPVRGNVEDPQFSYGGVIGKAMLNLITRIITSPFALLANLVGVEADELEYITFIAGRSDMTPPELEKAAKLAEALALRPELVLDIRGVVDRDRDGQALRTSKLDQLVEERIAALGATGGDDEIYSAQRTRVLEALYAESSAAADPGAVLAEMRLRHTTVAEPGEENAAQEDSFDELAYSAELRRQLIESQPLEENEFAALANDRAAHARDSILSLDAALVARVVIGQPKAVEGESDGPVKMQVSLSTGEVSAPMPEGPDAPGKELQ
jgi:hypothetical protein